MPARGMPEQVLDWLRVHGDVVLTAVRAGRFMGKSW